MTLKWLWNRPTRWLTVIMELLGRRKWKARMAKVESCLTNKIRLILILYKVHGNIASLFNHCINSIGCRLQLKASVEKLWLYFCNPFNEMVVGSNPPTGEMKKVKTHVSEILFSSVFPWLLRDAVHRISDNVVDEDDAAYDAKHEVDQRHLSHIFVNILKK